MDKSTHKRTASDLAGHGDSMSLRVLILEDNPQDVELSLRELKKSGFELQADAVDTEEGFAAKLESGVYDLILSDYRIPAWSGIDAFRLLKQSRKDIPFILVTGTLGEEAAVELIKEGVTDYILKDRLFRLPSAVRRAMREKGIRDERERDSRAVRESEEQVRLLLDSTAEGIYGVNLEGNCTFCNAASLRLLGYDNPDDFLQKTMHGLIHHTRADGTPYPIEECQTSMGHREGKCFHRDDEILWRKDGSSFPAEYWSYPVVRDGMPIGSVVTFLDISERKQREEALRKSEVRYQRLMASSIIGMGTSSLDGTFLDGNDAFLQLLGATREELLAGMLRWDEMTPPEYHDIDQRGVEHLRNTGAAPAWEKEFIRRDGSRVAVLIGAVMLAREGSDNEAAFFVIDISERKTLESNLRRLAAVVESSDDAIISETLDGIILTWNYGAEKVFGYSSAEMLEKSVSTIVPVDRRGEVQDILRKIRSGQKVEQLETIRLKKDGQQVHVSLSVSPIKDAQGQITSASSIGRDVTETKRMEEMFRQAQKMEAVGRLAGGVAHDFNNILGVIIGYGEIVGESLNENDPLRAKIEQITKAGRRAARLTRQLLAFSRQQILEPTILNLNSIVMDVKSMLQRLIGEDIELVTNLSPHLASVKADQGQIEQIIMNLAINSRDAMLDGGTLTIESANVELEELYALNHPGLIAGSFVMLRVTDTGVGMDAETQKHIFEPFFTTKEQGKGTGLGLATVYGVIKQSFGCISVSSHLGQGTTFEIYLPQVQVAPKLEQESVGPNGPSEGTETVLLVEDEESLRTLTREVLLESHYTILEASDGLEALEIAQQHEGPIHLLLTDVVMPRMGGRALAKQLAVQNPEMKVLFMSGYTGNTLKDESEEPLSFLRKPFTRRDLREKVCEALESRFKSPVTET